MASLPLPCPMHTDEDVVGVKNADGAYEFTCTRSGHPGGGPFSWIQDPVVEKDMGMGGLADELGLDVELPAALKSLGDGWFEYGLVERAYATSKPDDFCQMVGRWGHTARGESRYSASAYIAGVLGRLATARTVALQFGPGTGRWDYNQPTSFWSLDSDADWEKRTSWVSVIGDDTREAKDADTACLEYVGRC